MMRTSNSLTLACKQSALQFQPIRRQKEMTGKRWSKSYLFSIILPK